MNACIKKISLGYALSFLFLVTLFGLPSLSMADNEFELLKKTVAQQQKIIDELQKTVKRLAEKDKGASLKQASSPVTQPSVATPPVEKPITEGQVRQIVKSLGQEEKSKFLASGYGAAEFVGAQHENGSFEGSFNPIFAYQANDDLQMNTELEVVLRDDAADFDLEQAQITYNLADNITLAGGKFVLPFNQFNERLHPYWINKLPSFAPIYADEVGGGRPGVVPLMTDVGLEARGGARLWKGGKLNYALYTINGPKVPAPASDAEAPVKPDLDFGSDYADVNQNKTIGSRVGLIPISDVEVGGSVMSGRYGDAQSDFTLLGADAVYKSHGLEVRAEYVNLGISSADFGRENRYGYYSLLAFRPGMNELGSSWSPFYRKLELVARVGKAETVDGSYNQFMPGIVYWLDESVPLKFGYEFNDGKESLGADRFLTQLAFGF